MARNVFLSFLGTNNYLNCVYELNGHKSIVVKYVQTALLDYLSGHYGWDSHDKVFIFTTNEAEGKNNIAAPGNWRLLQDEIAEKKPDIKVENVHIKSGKNVDEIWANFSIMYDVLEEGDALYIDITHSFRSIPLLFSSLMHYAKFLKKVEIKALYYGAFETLEMVRDIERQYPDPHDRIAPVFDLTAFSEIQDWAIAANDFIRFGNSEALGELTEKNINLIVREKAGFDGATSKLKKLNTHIQKLCLDIKTNRSSELIEGTHAKGILETLNSLDRKLIQPLGYLLPEIRQSVSGVYKNKGSIMNVLYTVEWCIDKHLIQEGFTLLREGVVSYILGSQWSNSQKKREHVSAYLIRRNGRTVHQEMTRSSLYGEERENLEEYLESIPNVKQWADLYAEIANVRNNISHAGINRSENIDFEDRLDVLYGKTLKLIENAD